jgi:toxin ParE1/3/4
MPRAERDLASIYDRIQARSSATARAWYMGLRNAIRGLSRIPARCPMTPEDKNLRHLLYGKYRIIYRIIERQQQVEVLHVRHGAMDEFSPAEF